MKTYSLLKPVVIFFLLILCLAALYNKGLIGNYLRLFSKGYRIEFIKEFSKGQELTQQYFLAYNKEISDKFIPVENYADDFAIYYFTPALKNILGINIVSSYWLLTCSLLLLSFSIAAIGINLLFTNYFAKLIAYCYLGFFALFSLHILDVHILQYFITSFIPILYWFWKKYISDQRIIYPILLLILIGILIGVSNQFRSHAGNGVLLVIISFLILERTLSIAHKFIFICLLMLSTPVCSIFLSTKLQERNEWLLAHQKDTKSNREGHVFWHSLYIGLGFEENKYGINWDDVSGFDKAKAIDPTNDMMNLETRNINTYESIIKEEYLKILKQDPLFVLKTLAIKSSYIFLFILLFFNYGFVLLKNVKINYRIVIPLLIGIGFYFSQGILGFPLPFYFLGALNLLVICELLLINEYFSTKINTR